MGGFNYCCIVRVFRISAECREIVSVLRLPIVELTTLPKKPKWPTGSSLSPKPSALVAGWLGSDTKLDYADTNSPDRS